MLTNMEYRRIGKSGVKVSVLSFGSWVTFASQLQGEDVSKILSFAFDHGVNFFDNAEVYAMGKSEELMGHAFKKLGWPRQKFLVSTKFFWGLTEGPNEKNTLNRKYLLNAIEGSLQRLQLDYVDIAYCHRADPETPLEETCWAFHNMIERGQALYWGTSEWPASAITEAWEICDRNRFHKPIVEQPQYNLLHREKVESEFAPIYDRTGIGLTTWSPLASGILSGKYLKEIPKGSRAEKKGLTFLQEEIADRTRQKQLENFVTLARDYGTEPASLAIAWCAKNPRVSSVILGASNLQQLSQNLIAMTLLDKLPESAWRQAQDIFNPIS